MKPLLMPIKAHPDHDPSDNDGNAEPLGTHERVTAKVGSQENITEPTAKWPRTGHKQKRRPRLILGKGNLSAPAAAPPEQTGMLRRLAQHVADTHRRMAEHHQQMAAQHTDQANAHCALEKAAVGQVLWGE